MNALLLALAAAGAALAAPATPVAPPSLAAAIRAAKWRQRVLLVTAPTAAQPDFQRQHQLLAAEPAQLRERDVLVLDVPGDQLTPTDRQYLTHELHLKLSGFEVVLLGKDGGVKERSTQPLPAAALFGTIDKMPMRQQEMRRH